MLQRIKEKNGVQKIGFSLYHPEEWFKLMDDGVRPDLIQVPYNLFDRRFETVFEQARSIGTEVHIRSVFLQGLFFRDPTTLPAHFKSAHLKLTNFQRLCQTRNIHLAAALLRFVLANPLVDRAVIGVITPQQLMTNATQVDDPKNDIGKYISPADFTVVDQGILNPALWP